MGNESAEGSLEKVLDEKEAELTDTFKSDLDKAEGDALFEEILATDDVAEDAEKEAEAEDPEESD